MKYFYVHFFDSFISDAWYMNIKFCVKGAHLYI